MARTHSHPMSNPPSLGELRAFVAATQDLPDDARIAVRIGFGGGGAHGSRPTKITAIEQDGKKTR